MQKPSRIVGISLLLCALPLTLRMVWETTWLTWQGGPQMVGFSMAHEFPALLLFGAAAFVGLAAWTVYAIVICLWKRSTQWPDILLIGLALAMEFTPSIPQPAWSTATEYVLGLSPQAPRLLVDAARQGQLERVRYLLDRGVSVDPRESSDCAAIAVAGGSKALEMVRLLLEHHANPNGSCDGTPALMNAVKEGNLATIKLLISAGARTGARDSGGFTAYDTALFAERKDVIEYMESIGAP